jgi:Transposase DDE domain
LDADHPGNWPTIPRRCTGKLIKGIKLHALCDKHGSLLDLELTPANCDDRAAAGPMLPRLAELGFQGDLLGDSGYKSLPPSPG